MISALITYVPFPYYLFPQANIAFAWGSFCIERCCADYICVNVSCKMLQVFVKTHTFTSL